MSKEGRKALALRAWEALNPHQIKYELIDTTGPTVRIDRVQETRRLLEEGW